MSPNKDQCYQQVLQAFEGKQGLAEQRQQRNIQQAEREIEGLADLNRQIQQTASSFFGLISGESVSEEQFNQIKQRSLDLQQRRAELLYEHGYPIDFLDKQYDCPQCKDTGFTESGEECKCFKKALAEAYLQHSNLKTIYKNKTFKHFDTSYYANNPENEVHMQKILEYCKKYTQKFGKQCTNMLFLGNPGCGKTFLSCAVGVELIKNGYFVLYTPVQQMIDVFEAAKFKNDRQADTSVYTECDLLIIDDLGAEMQTGFSDSVLYSVINDRLNLKKPMLISTNLTIEQLEGTYHERLTSRLIYEFAKLPFAGVDVRREKEVRLKQQKRDRTL